MAHSTLKLNQTLKVKGCVTEMKAIRHIMDRPHQLARVLGFNGTYLKEGYAVLQSQEIPKKEGFELAGYTNVPVHRFKEKFPNKSKVDLRPLAMKKFNKLGPYGLAKIIPLARTKDRLSCFPPGQGVAQWRLTRDITMKVIAVFE